MQFQFSNFQLVFIARIENSAFNKLETRILHVLRNSCYIFRKYICKFNKIALCLVVAGQLQQR